MRFEWDEQKADENRRGGHGTMKKKHITSISFEEAFRNGSTWVPTDNPSEEEIEARAASDPDNPPFTAKEMAAGRMMNVVAALKKPVYIRLDPEIVLYFKWLGGRYQTRINAVLKEYVRHAMTSGEGPLPEVTPARPARPRRPKS